MCQHNMLLCSSFPGPIRDKIPLCVSVLVQMCRVEHAMFGFHVLPRYTAAALCRDAKRSKDPRTFRFKETHMQLSNHLMNVPTTEFC